MCQDLQDCCVVILPVIVPAAGDCSTSGLITNTANIPLEKLTIVQAVDDPRSD